MNIKKVLGMSFAGGCAFSSVVSCSPTNADVQEGNFEAELLQEVVQGGNLLEKFKEVTYSWANSFADLFKEGGFNDSSKECFVLQLDRAVKCRMLLEKLNYTHSREINEIDAELEVYIKSVLPKWFIELLEQYGTFDRTPEVCIPAEHREAFRFLVKEFNSVSEKYKL